MRRSTAREPERAVPAKPRLRPAATRLHPRAALALRLQRAAGNGAAARLLRGRPPGRAIARFQLIQAGWAEQAPTFYERHRLGRAGFNPGSANRGWIRIRDAAGPARIHFAMSDHAAGQHTEALLLAWATQQGANLALAPNAPVQAARVLSLYTERHPCGNCQVLLAQLNNATPVYWSVPNTLEDHRALMFQQVQRHIRLTEGARLTAAHGARVGALGGGAHPGLDTLLAQQQAALAAAPAATPDTFAAWDQAMTTRANLGIAAIGAWAPPAPAPALMAPPPYG